jgi:predicted DCC family thiol-disulfide oxidoreductase YuxK
MPEPYSYRGDPAVPPFADDRPVIVFDGHCVLCSGGAQFVLRHDPHGHYRLLAAQTPLGEALYKHFGLNASDYDTMILIKDGAAVVKADAVIGIAQGLGLPWSLAVMLRVLPRSWRDGLYGILARNRLRVFGRSETCYMPDPRWTDRFLA